MHHRGGDGEAHADAHRAVAAGIEPVPRLRIEQLGAADVHRAGALADDESERRRSIAAGPGGRRIRGAGPYEQRLYSGANRSRSSRRRAGVARGRRSRRAVGAIERPQARVHRWLRSPRQRRRAGGGSHPPGTALSLSARPAVAQDRLSLLVDGRVVLTLKTAWTVGTRYLVFEPLELLEKLAALTPRPRINLVLYHGVLAPHARWRARVVAYGATPVSRPVPASPSAKVSASDDTATTPNPRHWAWADLMRRAFDIDVACPRCGGR